MNEWQVLIAGKVEEAQRDYAWNAAVEASKMDYLHFESDAKGSLNVTMVYYNGELDFSDNPVMRIDLKQAAKEIIETHQDRWGDMHLDADTKEDLMKLSENLKAAAAEIDSALS